MRNHRALVPALALILAGFVFPMLTAHAAELAEKKVVLQISDNTPEKQELVLNVANNLLKHYGPDKVTVEIVAFGPGLNLLMAKDNKNADRLQSLEASNVQLSACGNTMAGIEKKTGHKPVLIKQAKVVPAGVVRIMELTGQGYTLIRP